MRMDAGFPQQGVGAAGALERVRGQFNYVAGGAMVMLPLFNRNQGQVAAAQAERSGAEARREAAELAARAEVAAAQARDARAQRAVSLYAGGVRTLARQNLNVVRQTFDLGRATVFDVLTEQRRYLEIEQAYTTALREAWEARAALEARAGRNEMNSESRVSVRWPVLVVAAVVLLAVGAGAAYVGLRSRAPDRPSSNEQATMPGTRVPAAGPADGAACIRSESIGAAARRRCDAESGGG